MPQEIGTANLVIKRGAGILLKQAKDIVPVVRRMVEDTAHYSAMRAATLTLGFPNATRQIVEEIAALLPARSEMEEEALLGEVVSA
jgi:UDP-N-acetylglucosamine:LPS N-acetylglucosamine transferase